MISNYLKSQELFSIRAQTLKLIQGIKEYTRYVKTQLYQRKRLKRNLSPN